MSPRGLFKTCIIFIRSRKYLIQIAYVPSIDLYTNCLTREMKI